MGRMTKTQELLYARCRMAHLWMEVPADKSTDIGWYFWHRCERCGTIRMDTINIRGELSRRSYRYPEGYRESRLSGMTKSDYRLIILNSNIRHRYGKIA